MISTVDESKRPLTLNSLVVSKASSVLRGEEGSYSPCKHGLLTSGGPITRIFATLSEVRVEVIG